MNERVAAVIEGFKNLTDREKIVAYLAIEEIWKAMQAKPIAPRPTAPKLV
jgi:hypothetical protein